MLVSLLNDYGYTVNPLILIIEVMERYIETAEIKELAGKVAEDLSEGYKFTNRVSEKYVK